MAIVKAVNSKASIGKAINYVTKEEKTEERLVSGKDCSPTSAIDEMKATKELWNKTEGRQYKHYVQSFNPEDNVTPEQAHELGKQFAEQEKFKGHEVLIATHKDKDHIHNHFIVNSVNFENGSKYQESKSDLENLKAFSNEQSREHGLTEPQKGDSITTFDQDKYQALLKGVNRKESSYLVDTAKDVSHSLKVATDRESFIKEMEKKGYEVNWKDTRKYVTFTTPEGKKVRNNNLEKTFKQDIFSKEGMENEIRGYRKNTEQESEQSSIRGLNERNNGIEQAHGELHKGSHEGGHAHSNDHRQGTRTDKHDKPRDTNENDLDFEQVRKHAEKLRRETSSAYGKWKDGNEQEQQSSVKQNDRDRENAQNKHGRDEQKHAKNLERSRTKDFDLSR